ncbi:uncharacterized protein LOC115447235 [Manduca sexta]|uniref:uncharacterized protein LOC115447235 n=1 Tax=Manduca sexta TaxID=7130 RepID=UPI00188F1993|nr:uncharacterized protein LOC115447235 [Manduca sexta]
MDKRRVKKAMIKDEVSLLLDLIQENPIINAKETNAATNRLKDDAWTSLAHAFNARSRTRTRTKEQLKLKWDNLKKKARKRAQLISMDQQIDSAKLAYMTPDKVLDKVAVLLESNYTVPNDPLCGDGISHGSPVLAVSGVPTHIVTNKPILALTEVPIELENAQDGMKVDATCEGVQAKKEIESEDSDSFSSESSRNFFDMPTEQQSIKKKGKRSEKVEISIIKRNLAIARYYERKSEKLDLEIKLLRLQLAKK